MLSGSRMEMRLGAAIRACLSQCPSACGQYDGEAGSFTQLALYRNTSVHVFNGVLDDGEPQSGAADGAGPGFVYAIESLENSGEVLGRDSDAGVGDGHFHGVSG